LEPALVAESARWGDAHRTNTLITPDDWRQAVEGVLADFFPWRTEVVLRQLAAQGWWSGPIPTTLSLTRLSPGLDLRWFKHGAESTQHPWSLQSSFDGGRSWAGVTNRILDRYGFNLVKVRPTVESVLYRLVPQSMIGPAN